MWSAAIEDEPVTNDAAVPTTNPCGLEKLMLIIPISIMVHPARFTTLPHAAALFSV